MKRVRITLELTNRFVGLLHSQLTLRASHEKAELTPMELIALLVCGEARGMMELQLGMAVPIAWREADLEPKLIHEERRVYVECPPNEHGEHVPEPASEMSTER